MSKLTFKIKHNRDFTKELSVAKKIAEFVVKENRYMSSKDVKHFGLNSKISNQIIRKYGRNKTIKNVHSVPLIIPGQGIKFNNNIISFKCGLNVTERLYEYVEKVNQVEVDKDYLYICCTVSDKPQMEVAEYIGIDRNATSHIAVCSVGKKIVKMGKQAPHINKKYANIRKGAQKRRNFAFIKKLKNRESRITKDINHKISRKIVDMAYGNKMGIKLENLNGIRGKKSFNKKLNATKSNWSFYQLQTFIEYKDKLLGVPVVFINPEYTSQRCSCCGFLGVREKKKFVCTNCGHIDHADANAAFNIAQSSQVVLTKDRDLVKSGTGDARLDMVQNANQPKAYGHSCRRVCQNAASSNCCSAGRRRR
jgi:putative transposase